MLLERSFIAIEQGNSSFYFRNSRIPYYVIPQLDWGSLTIGILKFSHCEGAKQREQSRSKFRLKSPSLRGFEKKEGAISKNSSFYFRNSSFLGVRGFLLSKI